MKLWSDSWANGERIPERHAAGRLDTPEGATFSDNVSPHLAWSDLPGRHPLAGPDLPRLRRAEQGRRRQPGRPRSAGRPARGSTSSTGCWSTCRQRQLDRRRRLQPGLQRARQARPDGGGGGFTMARQGINDYTGWFAGNAEMAGDYYGYDGPFPPWNDSLIHHYVFTLYALDVARAPVEGRFAGAALRQAIYPHVLGAGDALRHLHAEPPPALMADGIAAPARQAPGTPVDPHEAHLTRVVAVRHGETTWNAEMRMQGQLDTPLSARGRWQAGRAAESLADAGIEAIFASDLERAYDTAQALAARLGLPITTDVGLRERSFGIFQGHLYAEIDLRWPDEAARWRHHDPDFGPEGGETLREFSARAVAACTRIAAASPAARSRIVTHGGVLGLPSIDADRRCGPSRRSRSWELGNSLDQPALYTPRGFTQVGWKRHRPPRGRETLDDGSEGDPPVPVRDRPAMSGDTRSATRVAAIETPALGDRSRRDGAITIATMAESRARATCA
jgi:probable phosphoglycerate mutase